MAITDRPLLIFYPFDVIQQVYEEVARYNFLLNRIGTAGISLLVGALAATWDFDYRFTYRVPNQVNLREHN